VNALFRSTQYIFQPTILPHLKSIYLALICLYPRFVFMPATIRFGIVCLPGCCLKRPKHTKHLDIKASTLHQYFGARRIHVRATCFGHHKIQNLKWTLLQFCYRTYRGADKSLARQGMKQARKLSGTRAISTISRRELSSFFPLQGKAPKALHAILTETLFCFLPGRAKDLSAPCTFYSGLTFNTFSSDTLTASKVI